MNVQKRDSIWKCPGRLNPFQVFVVGSYFALMAVGLAGCTGPTGPTGHVSAPSITTQPANQTVVAGQTATFTVVATGTAPLSYQWQKNGANITDAASSSYSTAATVTSDSGSTFDVVVSNSAGTATSNAATLTVNAPAPTVGFSPTSLAFGNQAAGTSSSAQFVTFTKDLSSGNLPNYSFITPNGCDDAHDCGLGNADNWLKNNIDPLIKNSVFQKDGLLIVVFDESGNDGTNGGGHVVCAMISRAFSKLGYQSSTVYQHESVLRLTLEGLGVIVLPSAASNAPAMWGFFTF
jgi:Phosphoesterase family/Immunoglobulin domain